MLTENEINIAMKLAEREGLISEKNKSFGKYLKMFNEKERPARIYAVGAKLFGFLFKLDNARG